MRRCLLADRDTEVVSGSIIRFDANESSLSTLFAVNIDLPILEIKAGGELAILTESRELYFQKEYQKPEFVFHYVESFAIHEQEILFSSGNQCYFYCNNKMSSKTLDERIIQVGLGCFGVVRTKTKIYLFHMVNAQDGVEIRGDPSIFLISDFTTDEIADMQVGDCHIAVLTVTGKVFTYGNSTYGQCGRDVIETDDNTYTISFGPVILHHPVTQICCGRLFTFCVVDKRTVYAFGVDNYNQLGINGRGALEEPIPKLCDLKNVEGDVIKVYCGGYQSILRTSKFFKCINRVAHGDYGVGTNGSLFLRNLKHEPRKWTKLDQPFCTDGSKYEIAMGYLISIAYTVRERLLTFSNRARENFKDVELIVFSKV